MNGFQGSDFVNPCVGLTLMYATDHQFRVILEATYLTFSAPVYKLDSWPSFKWVKFVHAAEKLKPPPPYMPNQSF